MKHRFSKPSFFACALALCSALAQAQPIKLSFSYTGFYDRQADTFLPDRQLQGAFAGDDANANGVLELAELSSLTLGGIDYIACAATSSPYATCGADRFMFSAQDGLSFSLGNYGADPEGWAGGGHLITSGEMDYEYRYDPVASSEHHLLWTGDTRLALQDGSAQAGVLATVPEAPVWAMLLAGAGAMGALQRRQAGHQARHRRRT